MKDIKIDIHLKNVTLKIIIIKKKYIKKNIYFQIKDIKNTTYLEVRTPYSTSNKELSNILDSNIDKIEKIYNNYLKSKEARDSIERDSELLLFGKIVKIEIINSKNNLINFRNSSIVIETHLPFTKELKEQVREKLYKKQAKIVITPLVVKWQNIMHLYSTNLRYQKTKSQWGSCSSKNRISLNSYLCLLPIKLIEYVIIHELAHIKHKNHSKEFWGLVNYYLPNYKELREELKIYSKFIR